jgi:2-(1,2-epoxy-1,2-dihydrophenyl)acetyl-CoA isomerase
MTEDVVLDIEGPVARVVLNRPDLGNAVTPAQAEELCDALERLERDGAVRVLVLTGSGSTFNVGALDPARHHAAVPASPDDPARRYRAQIPLMQRVIEILHESNMVSIAAVNGGCAGAGFALALAADLRYAAASARFNSAFLSAGLPGELGAIWFATTLLGASRARELFLLPAGCDAARLAELGLLNGVSEDGELLPRVAEIAGRLAAAPAGALTGMKANLLAAEHSSLADYLPFETDGMLRCLTARTVEESGGPGNACDTDGRTVS